MGGPSPSRTPCNGGPILPGWFCFNPEIVELRRAGWGFAVLESTEPVTMTGVPVAPSCFDASDDDAMEEDWLEAQVQEMFDIDYAEVAISDEPGGQNPLLVEHARERKLIFGRLGSHSPSCRKHLSPWCGAACCVFLEGRRL